MRSFLAIILGLVAASALYWYQNPDLELKVPEGLIAQVEEQRSARQPVPYSFAAIDEKSTPGPTRTVRAVSTATPTPRPTRTATAEPGDTPTPKPKGAAAEILATPTSRPIRTATAEPTATPTPKPTPSPSRTPTPTATAEPTANPVPSLRHLSLKEYMLDLINKERTAEGLQSVALGDNAAAQIHAEEALDGCFGGHWGRDGLTPYMRYSLAGGYQSNGENGSGLDYCIRESDGFSLVGDIRAQIRQRMKGWMGSPGHRANLLKPWHRKVNIGLAWDTYTLRAFQHFEGDYVHFDQVPVIPRLCTLKPHDRWSRASCCIRVVGL